MNKRNHVVNAVLLSLGVVFLLVEAGLQAQLATPRLPVVLHEVAASVPGV